MDTTNEYPCDAPGCGVTFFSGRELGGHRKTHNAKRPSDRPACFTDDAEWQSAISRLRQEHPTVKNLSHDYALAESCAVCPLEFMQEMQSRGRCHPPAGAVPQRDLGLMDED